MTFRRTILTGGWCLIQIIILHFSSMDQSGNTLSCHQQLNKPKSCYQNTLLTLVCYLPSYREHLLWRSMVNELPTMSQDTLYENLTRVSDISLSKQNRNLPASLWRIPQVNSSPAYEFTLSFLLEAVHWKHIPPSIKKKLSKVLQNPLEKPVQVIKLIAPAH